MKMQAEERGRLAKGWHANHFDEVESLISSYYPSPNGVQHEFGVVFESELAH